MAPIRCCFDQTAVWHSDAARGPSTPSFNHLVGGHLQRQWHGKTERFGGLEVDHQLELDWGLDGKIARLLALEDAIGIGRRAPKVIGHVNSVGQQAAKFSEEAVRIDGREAVASSQRYDLYAMGIG